MSVRLNVVIVQSPNMSSLQVGVVADIVIQLLGRPGIDVAMVTSLQPEDEHTDRLMLTSLDSDLAVIDWRSANETLDSLAGLGLHVRRSPHALDPDVSVVPGDSRRVYVFDLRLGFKADEVVRTLAILLQQRQVVTVPLLMPGMKRPSSQATQAAADRPVRNVAPVSMPTVSMPTVTSKATADVANLTPSPPQRQRSRGPSYDQEADLDALVDGVNDIDL